MIPPKKTTPEAYEALTSSKMKYSQSRSGVLYIQADGAALNTRIKDESGSSWRENKLGEVFTSDNIRYWTNSKGQREHRILKKEYVSYIGSVDEFKKHLLACAIRNGYGLYKEVVFLGDGATWCYATFYISYRRQYHDIIKFLSDFLYHIYRVR